MPHFVTGVKNHQFKGVFGAGQCGLGLAKKALMEPLLRAPKTPFIILFIGLGLVSLLSLNACTYPEKQKFTLPKDEGTPEQYELLYSARDHLQKVADKENIEADLSSITLRISSVDNKEAHGVCSYNEDPTRRYIVISVDLFKEKEEKLTSEDELALRLKHLLLHEYGHCLFDHHEHDDETLHDEKKVLSWPQAKVANMKFGNFFKVHVSIMISKAEKLFPEHTLNYYFRELVDRERATSLDDYAKFTGAQISPRQRSIERGSELTARKKNKQDL